MDSQLSHVTSEWRKSFGDSYQPCGLHSQWMAGPHIVVSHQNLLNSIYSGKLTAPLKLNELRSIALGGQVVSSGSWHWVAGTLVCQEDFRAMDGFITKTVGLSITVELKARDDLMKNIKDEIDRCEFILHRYSLPKDHPEHPWNNRFNVEPRTDDHIAQEVEMAERLRQEAIERRESLSKSDETFQVVGVGGIILRKRIPYLHRLLGISGYYRSS